MTTGVIDDLELVQIEITDRVRGLSSLGALECPFQAILEFAAIDQAGENVMAGVITQTPIQLTGLADIVEHQYPAGHLALAVLDRRSRALNIEFVAVAPYEQRRSHRLDRSLPPNGHGQRVFQRFAGLFMEAAENFVYRSPNGVVKLPAAQLLRDRVEILDEAGGIRGNDSVADRPQCNLCPFFLPEQGFFIKLALRDIEFDPDQSLQTTVGVRQRFCPAQNPAPFAIAMAHAVRALENIGLAFQMLTNLALNPRHVIRVHQVAPVGN